MHASGNKRALITGATGEIGTAIAEALYESGYHVTLSGRNEEILSHLTKNLGERANFIVSDLNNMEQAEELIQLSIKKMGGVDILINNAGLNRDNLFLRMSNDEWSNVLDINLNASMVLTRGAIKHMMKSRWGRIINITSIVGVTGNPGQANYAASKSGLIGMSKCIAQEVASRGITVNCVAPGFISSAMTRKLDDSQQARILASIPMKRMGKPDDVANVIVFLSSDGANYITGQTFHINGGMAMI